MGQSGSNSDLKVESVQKLLDEAEKFSKAGMLLDAKKRYDEILASDPENVVANQQKGIILYLYKKYELAYKLLKKALDREENVLTLLYLGKTLNGLERYVEAIGYFDAILLKHDPNDVEALYGKGYALNRKNVTGNYDGRFDNAIECFETLLKLDPRNTFALVEEARAYERLQKYDKALRCYEKIVEYEPDNILAISGIGFLSLHNLGEDERIYKRALDCFEKALVMQPNDPYFIDYKMQALVKLGRYKEALGCHDAIAQLYSNSVPNNPSAVLIHILKGHTEYQKARISCDDRRIPEAYYRLNQAMRYNSDFGKMAAHDERFRPAWGDHNFQKVVREGPLFL
ncbi:cytochrome c biogenesis factor [Candidatus Nitrososphaera evergladensis SR1]|uniref:Cytochrome c biogenesis factor n=1 Tax=Candidatus Nitrososphaera evergladensis SR1 TaxID=1459636 RepID=A0A075MTS9_9ARCH|nr:tetratricopeptide repeat protein [Candidatus Nitrososphaera evergladensis]AIF85026.1 cytochrome c biogenesis factor [Candidatus Nitrososphaera evergladensis SR1]